LSSFRHLSIILVSVILDISPSSLTELAEAMLAFAAA